MLLTPATHVIFLDHLTPNYASSDPTVPTAAGKPNYPMRREPTAGGGRWTVQMTSSTAPSLNLTLQGRVSADHLWSNITNITQANLTTQGQPANTYTYGASVPLYPEMRCLVTTLTGTTPLLSSWITG